MSTTLRIRRGTSSHMSDKGSSVLLQSGELFAEYQSDNSVKLKLGDGETLYSELPYITSPAQEKSDSRTKVRYLISASNWSDTTNDDGYYTYLLYLTSLVNMDYNPNIYLTGVDDDTIYTDTEETQYGYLKRYDLIYKDKLVLYANTKPDADFYIFVEGIVLFSLDDYFDPITHIADESKFLEFLKLKYYSSNLIGYKVQLSNTTEYNNGTWIIADINHDSANTGQSNCYDLISQDCFYNTSFGSSQSWRSSNVRTWLNDTFYNGFSSNLKNRLMNPKYNSQGTWYNDDYVILPSYKEINGETSSYQDNEGTAYPIFTDNNSRIKYQGGTSTASAWWTRSRNTSDSGFVWFVITDGDMFGNPYSISYYLAPLLRIS